MRMPETVILGQVTSEVTLSSTGSKIGREKGVDDVDDEPGICTMGLYSLRVSQGI